MSSTKKCICTHAPEQHRSKGCNVFGCECSAREIDFAEEEIKALRDTVVRMSAELSEKTAALLRISRMGRVCPDFETCKHPACGDSAGAALLAMEALLTDQQKKEKV